MHSLTAVSLMSDNHRPFYQGVAEYLEQRTGISVLFVNDRPWKAREHMLDQGQAQIAFICGLPYADRAGWLDLLAAPVMRAARYGDRPVYFSDIVVHRDSSFRSFGDLRGATWAYNEPDSWSGCVALRAHIAAQGQTRDYCGRIVESGAHLESLRMILSGEIDAAAIDSTVLELVLASRPEVVGQIQVVDSIGPNMFPPAVIRNEVPDPLKRGLRDALLHMHEDQAGANILELGMVARFNAVADADYDDIRRKAQLAERVQFDER
jgi:phosphonate transport system substrate-binding protein